MGAPRSQVSIERTIVYYLGWFLVPLGITLFVLAFFTSVADFGEWFGMDAQQTSLAVHALGGVLLAGLGGFLVSAGVRGWAERDSILDPRRAPGIGESRSAPSGGIARDAMADLDLPQTVRDRLDKEDLRLKVKCPKCRAVNQVTAKYCYACSARL